MSARDTALNVLIACRKEGGWSNALLKEYLSRDRLDRREAALATRLCYGVLQNRLLLDHYLQQLLTGKLKSLHPAARDILHLGLYQLYFMDKIPQSAAVNECVGLAKRYCKDQKNAPGLVNAVLRSAITRKDTLTQPRSYVERYSHPQALVDLLKDYAGKERLEQMLRANNEIPPTVVQVNTLKTTAQELKTLLEAEGATVNPHSWMPDCLVLTGTGDLEKLDSFQQGLFYVQDAASRLSVLCACLPNDREVSVLDCCAAPGGKSFTAAIAMGGRGQVISCDVYDHKAQLIQKGAQRLGLSSIQAMRRDATQPKADWEAAFDTVIVDAPCSGYGIIRKKPDIRYKDPASMKDLPGLQLQILQNQSRFVRPGGTLMYSTCTLVRAENEGVVEEFLKNNREFTLERLTLPDNFPKNETGMMALFPGEYDTDGFFIARLRRTL